MVNKRIEYVDILKGIGIICVLLGHNLVIQSAEKLPEVMRYIIYSFHMPLFFFLSGYVFSAKGDAITFLKKKIKTIIVPMYIFSLMVILFNCIYYGVLLGDKSILKLGKITTSLLSSLFGMELFGCQPTLWFLPCLFSTQVLLFFLVKILRKKEKLLVFAFFIIYLMGVINVRMLHIKFPFMFERALFAIFFVGIGYIIKTYHYKLIDNLKKYLVILFMGGWIIALFVKQYCFGYNIGMVNDAKNNALLQIIVSMSAIFALILIFRNSKSIKGISYIGRNSIIYYGLGDMFSFVPNIVLYNILKIDLSKIGNYSVIFSVFITISICVVLVPISFLINSKLGFIIGKKRF